MLLSTPRPTGASGGASYAGRCYATLADQEAMFAQLRARVGGPEATEADWSAAQARPAARVTAASPPPKSTARAAGRAWHRGSRFPGPGDFRRLDRKDRYGVWDAAQQLDRRTHTSGKHGGVLGHTGLIVLHCLLFDLMHLPTGRLDPTYETIAHRTNLARSTVIEAVGRLEAAGVLEVTRRIVREWVRLPGGRLALRTRQTSNAYRINYPTVDRGRLGDLAAPARPGPTAKSGNRAETSSPGNQSSDCAQEPTEKAPSSCCDSVERACGPSEPAG